MELRQTTGGALALVLYTSLERLVECCGEHQPWMKVPTKELPAVVEQVGAQVIREDVPLPGGTRGEDG
ncbi:SAV_915 family protein [Saccharopolyspora erythraea]|uniref:SAV_915 family protein n=1 Tax=Saccharopolyspora erythraea TaxID=1836 RepID=UPI0001D31490|nr:SAV_915 family protein [Saccharopolyspora erythraea]